MSVSPLVALFRDGARDTAFAQVDTEAPGTVSLVGDDLIRSGTGPAEAVSWDTDAFQERACADAVMTLAGCQ